MSNFETSSPSPDNNGARSQFDTPPEAEGQRPPVLHEDIDSGFAALDKIAADSARRPAYPPAPSVVELSSAGKPEDRVQPGTPLHDLRDQRVDAAARQSVAASEQAPQVQAPQSSKGGFFRNLAQRFGLGNNSKS